jgi:trehalose 6-phosphate phosphatase
VTDEAAFDVLPDFGGIGFSVGRELQGLAGVFETPSDVRRWIVEMAHIKKDTQ